MKQFEIRALVGKNGMGTIIEERRNGTDEDCNAKIVELRKEYGGFYSCQIYEDNIKIFDSTCICICNTKIHAGTILRF